MSFTSVALTENFINIVSDTQGTRDGVAMKEKYKKFDRISPNQVLAFGGTYGVFLRMLERFPYRNDPYNLCEVAKTLEELMYNEENKHLDSMFVLAGKETTGELIIYQRGRDNEKTEVKRPNNEIQFTYLPNEEAMKLNFDEIIAPDIYRLLQSKGKITPNKISKIQNKLNNVVADVDSTVNKITREITIKM